MDLTQTSTTQRRGCEAARPRAGLAGCLATASQVTAAARQLGTGMCQSTSIGRRPVAPIADRITDPVVLELIGSTHPGVSL